MGIYPSRLISFRLFVISLAVICINGCDFGPCFNSRPDPGPGRGVIELMPASNGETEGPNYQSVEGINLFAGLDHSPSSLISMNRTGEFFFVDSHFFSFQSGVQAPADTLAYCSFIPNTDRHVCVENRSDRLENQFTNNSVFVNTAQSTISVWENFVKQRASLFSVTSQFISADQFEITRILHPVFAEDEQEVVFIRQTETRQFTPGADEHEVLSIQNDLVLLDRSNSETVQVLLPSIEINNNLAKFLSISPDGRYITVALNFDEFVLFDRLSSTPTPFLSHARPSFSPSGKYLLTVELQGSLDRQLTILDLETRSAVDSIAVSRDHVYALHPHDDILFYVPGRGGAEGVSGAHLASFNIETQEQEALLRSDQVTYMREGRLSSILNQYFIGVTEQGALNMFSEIGSTFYDPDSDCN